MEHKSRKRRKIKIKLETLEQIQQLSLMNNAFMNLALEDNVPCVEEMLERVHIKSVSKIIASLITELKITSNLS